MAHLTKNWTYICIIQHQLDKLANEISLDATRMIKPFACTVIQKNTVTSIFWLCMPILEFQFSFIACVNPTASFTPNTNPSTALLHSKDSKGFSFDLVIEKLCHRFEKTSSCESIHCRSFTEFLSISIIFWITIETVGNIY